MTPTMALYRIHVIDRIADGDSHQPRSARGVTDHIWIIGELVEAATNPESLPPRYAPFAVIDG